MMELIKEIKELAEKIAAAMEIVKISRLKIEAAELEQRMAAPGFWSDQDNARQASQRAASLTAEINQWEDFQKEVAELLDIAELAAKNNDHILQAEIEVKLKALTQKFQRLELTMLFSGEYDENNAIVSIHAGTGGIDAQDWAEMLLRMYLRFAEQKNFTAKILDKVMGNEAGIKSVDVLISGRLAYGYLKAEAGVHRLVRISPFDAEKMRHTSFALVEVLPELVDWGDLVIKDEDLRIDTFRAGGHGGQSVNTTDSAVRITHLATGIVVICQNERSQKQNKEQAMKCLAAKFHEYNRAEKEEERSRIRGQFSAAAWGNQIRSYVIHPYKLVKDHRTEFETQDALAVLDGRLEDFMIAYLKVLRAKK